MHPDHTAPGSPPASPVPEGEGPIRIPVDPEIEDLIPMFLANRAREVEELRVALEAGDAETVRDVGHRMKGMGGGYGFDYVSTAGAALEDAAEAGRLDRAEGWVRGLAVYLERVEPVPGEG